LSEGGDVFLLEMGQPMLISDLAENMVRLAGLTVKSEDYPDGDIEIIATGKRPGEKMYEELFYDAATAHPTKHSKILRATPSIDDSAMGAELHQLRVALEQESEQAARNILFGLIVKTDHASAKAKPLL
ncbi:MAG TPA: polysaccharide biosynthesis protein, partial [Devosia sp.]|nr:polysaccharide biosynthesis protein [Devosia sp.]